MKTRTVSLKSLVMTLGLLFAGVMAFAQLQPAMQYFRYYDQRGVNVFETSKDDTVVYDGLKLRIGAGFTQGYQNLKHSNGLPPPATATTPKLYEMAGGFPLAQANFNIDVQLYDGVSLNLVSYMSSHHHNEFWVKGGYLQVDKVTFLNSKFMDNLWKNLTLKVGHMEVNYGDAHFRRSDGGQTIYNPFMDNLIVDDFATEIGGEVYLQKNGLFGMVGMTSGMIKGSIDSAYKTAADDNVKRAPSIYLKGGIDKTIAEKLRVRVSGSYYHNSSNAGSGLTLFGGDRTGSNYQDVMENSKNGVNSASTAIAFSGRMNPGFSKKIDAIMLNGFLKVQGLELFGTYETAKGRTKMETTDRKMNQLAGEVVYRFGKAENLFIGGRYNTIKMLLAGFTNDIKVDRTSLAAGWFVTKNVLMKGEYVTQNYKDFPTSDYRSSGKFKGVVIEAIVGF